MNLSIKAKFIAASLSLIALMAGLLIFLLRTQEGLEMNMNEIIDKNLTAIRTAEQIKYHVILYDDLIFRYLVTDEKRFLDEGVDALEEAKEWIQRMKALAEGKTEEELLEQIEQDTGRYRKGVRAMIGLYRTAVEAERNVQKRGLLDLFSGGAALEASIISQKDVSRASVTGRSRLNRINYQCEKMVDIYRVKMDAAQAQMRDKIRKTHRAAWLTGSAAFAAIFSVIFLLAFDILSSIRTLLTGVQKVSAGELDLELPVQSSDEIGRLTQFFNSMTRSLKEKQQMLVTETITDPLTGLYNLRHFQAQMEKEISRAQRHGHPFSLVIFDVDHFKIFNDNNGHDTGNILLKGIADLVRKSAREDEIAARYGGEEFVLILPEADITQGKIVAERIRSAVEQSVFPGMEKQPGGKVTLSAGGAAFPQDGGVSSELFKKADQALYKAKNAGRNQVQWA
ncbi:MAG: hypothetical protein A3A86_07650 [Elusimicrobia bacterium RIFCSPLOWO2_01_FULL_60_11]|nr:MAG: hypothetical protein A3A86_07650 [Elusimicrobia bacterium RIFCSPLOWO2_01_FULL_60_11]